MSTKRRCLAAWRYRWYRASMMKIKMLIFTTCLVVGLAPVGGTAQAQGACQFVLGFATLRAVIGADVAGECLENQRFAPNGNAEQSTSKGLMAWRKGDNWTAYTDGYSSWVSGPNGVQQRLNSQRFPWENDTPGVSPASGPPPAVAQPAPPAVAQPAALAAVPAPEAAARLTDEQFAGYLQTKYATLGNVQLNLRAEKSNVSSSPWIIFRLGGSGEMRPVLDNILRWQTVSTEVRRAWLLAALKEVADRWPGQDVRVSVDSEGYNSSSPSFECYIYSSYSSSGRGWFTIWHLMSASRSSRGDRIDERC